MRKNGRIDRDFADGIEDLVQISNCRKIETDGKRTDGNRGLGVTVLLCLMFLYKMQLKISVNMPLEHKCDGGALKLKRKRSIT